MNNLSSPSQTFDKCFSCVFVELRKIDILIFISYGSPYCFFLAIFYYLQYQFFSIKDLSSRCMVFHVCHLRSMKQFSILGHYTLFYFIYVCSFLYNLYSVFPVFLCYFQHDQSNFEAIKWLKSNQRLI